MGIIIVCLAIGIGVWIAVMTSDGLWDEVSIVVISFITNFFLAFLLGTLGCMIVGECVSEAPTHPIEIHDEPIYALVDNSGTDGTLFLGTGQIKDTLVYRYVVKDEFGRYSVKQHNCSESYIVYTDETPHITTIENEFDSKGLRWWYDDIKNTEYIFYVPEGSIGLVSEYDIDLK